jgi:hypothetical protein
MVIKIPCACGDQKRAEQLHKEDYYAAAKKLVKARRKQEAMALTVLRILCSRSPHVVRSVRSWS